MKKPIDSENNAEKFLLAKRPSRSEQNFTELLTFDNLFMVQRRGKWSKPGKGRNINNRARSVFKVLLLVHEAGGERHKTRAEEEESKLSSQSFNLEAEKISSFSPSMVSSRANQIYCSLLIVYILCYAVYVCSKYATLASLRLLSALTALIITLVSPGKKINQWETWHNVA